MRTMNWSWTDYCELPTFHFHVLRMLLNEQQKGSMHERALAESRRGR